MQKIKLIYLK